ESGDAQAENAAALNGIADGLARVSQGAVAPERVAAIRLVSEASAQLTSAHGFADFDRFTFIVRAGMPAARAVLALRVALDAKPVAARRLWRPRTATPFDSGAFDPWALAPEYAANRTPALVDEGRQLFFDRRLSGSGKRSCATCHQPSRAFTDGRAIASALGD